MSIIVEKFDCIVLGAGASGLGIAAALAERGRTVLVLERDRVGSGTSANSHRIIHGGLRYLQSLGLARSIRSIRDQRYCLQSFPGAVETLPCLMMLHPSGLKSAPFARGGAFLYHVLLRIFGGQVGNPRVLSKEEAARTVSDLQSALVHGVLYWEDAQITDPVEFFETLRGWVEDVGAKIFERSPVEKVSIREDGCVVSFREEQTEGDLAVRREVFSRAVINALGPWARSIELEGLNATLQPITWCRAFNLTLRKALSADYGVAVSGPEGRNYFLTPRRTGGAVGTEYLPAIDGAPFSSEIRESEIERFIQRINTVLPDFSVRRDDVTGVEAGLLPCLSMGDKPRLLAEEKVLRRGNYFEVISTKLTTFRSLGRRVAQLVDPFLSRIG